MISYQTTAQDHNNTSYFHQHNLLVFSTLFGVHNHTKSASLLHLHFGKKLSYNFNGGIRPPIKHNFFILMYPPLGLLLFTKCIPQPHLPSHTPKIFRPESTHYPTYFHFPHHKHNSPTKRLSSTNARPRTSPA